MEQWENRNVCLQAAECQSKRHAHGRGDEQGNDQGRGRQCRHGRDHKLTCGHGRHRSGQQVATTAFGRAEAARCEAGQVVPHTATREDDGSRTLMCGGDPQHV